MKFTKFMLNDVINEYKARYESTINEALSVYDKIAELNKKTQKGELEIIMKQKEQTKEKLYGTINFQVRHNAIMSDLFNKLGKEFNSKILQELVNNDLINALIKIELYSKIENSYISIRNNLIILSLSSEGELKNEYYNILQGNEDRLINFKKELTFNAELEEFRKRENNFKCHTKTDLLVIYDLFRNCGNKIRNYVYNNKDEDLLDNLLVNLRNDKIGIINESNKIKNLKITEILNDFEKETLMLYNEDLKFINELERKYVKVSKITQEFDTTII